MSIAEKTKAMFELEQAILQILTNYDMLFDMLAAYQAEKDAVPSEDEKEIDSHMVNMLSSGLNVGKYLGEKAYAKYEDALQQHFDNLGLDK